MGRADGLPWLPWQYWRGAWSPDNRSTPPWRAEPKAKAKAAALPSYDGTALGVQTTAQRTKAEDDDDGYRQDFQKSVNQARKQRPA